ncbi:Imm1 family immunity protein [Saccharopolyspora sp. K220]|uniref:Imm1 family immunity protein n=1 Tax=Saccharopolyspora soli TaxID=2926618 RepID=UPI001F595457|nr:Imm1 family immunity protein [Saccharopolyspora soli]MCI2418825.1 Imm1 family immunity protein [Saccharopolyspora soli]
MTVVTAIIDNQHRYARTGEEVNSLILTAVAEPHDWATLFYVWDRPCRESDDGSLHEYPTNQLRLDTEPDAGWGALNYVDTAGRPDAPGVWNSLNPEPPRFAPTIWFDPGTPTAFPESAVLPIERVRAALTEFCRTGKRPTCIQWQDGRWF